MKKLIEISEGRVAVIDIKSICNKPAIEEQAKRFTNDEQLSMFTLNDKPDLLRMEIRSIEILSPVYECKSVTLTGMDLNLIHSAASEYMEQLRREPYTLMDYYS